MNTTFGGRYQLVREIGAGGMGRVYQALDTETGESVAAKVLIPGSEEDLEGVVRFYQEAAVLSSLKHPNIVRVHGTYLEAQASCIVMEFLQGQSLADILRHERLSLARCKHIMIQVASALQYAHGRAVVHRDIKPGNIMIEGDDRVKVTDFGIARVLLAGSMLQTKTGQIIGTPLYMSPEQIEGGKLDGRSDIYSLGAVIYHCITGHPPFEGDDPLTVAFKHVHRPPDPPRTPEGEVPESWERLTLTMLGKTPAARYQTASQLGEALEHLSEEDVAPVGRNRSDISRTTAPAPTVYEPIASVGDSDTASLPDQPDSEAPANVTERAGFRPSPRKSAGSTDAGPRRRTPWSAVAAGAGVLMVALAALFLLSRLTSSSSGKRPISHGTVLPTAQRGGGVRLLTIWNRGALFDRPEDVAFDRTGRAYVADFTADRITIVKPNGTGGGALATPGNGRGQLSGPSGVAIDGVGNVYVADSNNARIIELSPAGKQLHAWGSNGNGPGQFQGPHDVVVTANGNVYVADFGNDRIQKLSSSGQVVASFGGTGKILGRLHGPVSLALDSSDNVYVADFYNNRIEKFSPTGRPLRQWRGRGRFVRPHGVAVDRRGDVYLTDYRHARVLELSPAGVMLHRWGRLGSGRGEFREPNSVALDPTGNVYVVDSGNNRIQKFAPPT